MPYLLLLQHFRETTNNLLSPFLLAASDFMVGVLPIIIIAFVYLCIDKRQGYFMMTAMWGTCVVNQLLKNTCCVYRPWIRDASIVPYGNSIQTATGYSFPSGHTEYATTFFGSIGLWLRRWWVWLLCILAVLVIGFSRNYLGVHTPYDVGVAIIESVLMLWAFSALFRWLEKHPEKDIWVLVGGIAVLIAYLLYVSFKPYPMDYNADGQLIVEPKKMITDCYYAAGLAFGVLTGWFIEHRYIRFSVSGKWYLRLLRFLFAAAAVVLIQNHLIPYLLTLCSPDLVLPLANCLMVWIITLLIPLCSIRFTGLLPHHA